MEFLPPLNTFQDTVIPTLTLTKKLPIVTHDKNRIDTVELAPFRAAIEADVAAIMSAHILFPALDSEFPATLSYSILTNILRQQLGYEGLIITDDLEMHAIDARYETGNAAVLAIQAGRGHSTCSVDPSRSNSALIMHSDKR